MKYYTGIGSRSTPIEICREFYQIASELEKKDYILRSGGANGADLSFEAGCIDKKEIYLPWKGFNNNSSFLHNITEEALELAGKTHPAWHNCSQGAKKLHARNCFQVLGSDLNTPSEFVICWTKDGKPQGGTATAIKLAEENNIPVYNFGLKDSREMFYKDILGKDI